MFDRLSIALGAGVLTAGVSAAMLAGAGLASAVTDAGSGGDTSTSDSSPVDTAAERVEAQTAGGAVAETQDDSHGAEREDAEREDTEVADTEDLTDAEPGPDDPDAERANQASEPASSFPAPLGGATNEPVTEGVEEPELSASADIEGTPDIVVEVEPEAATVAADGGSADRIVALEPTRPEPMRPEPTAAPEPAPAIERLSMASAADEPTAAEAAPRQTLLSVLGAVVFNLYSNAMRVVGGPPLLPKGSTVSVQSSTVEIDCGDGYEVPADWYVPAGPTPTQLIYLQHGFMAAAPFYSYTAARLAEATGSIVVATSLTSNFLACDGCWVGGSPMHQAVADLFIDGNTALADSAAAAGYGPSLLDGVRTIALTGHSAGGGLAAGAAGYLADNGAIDRLAGVVLLDGVGFGSVMPDALAKLPDELPVYNLAGRAYFWNMNGATGAALEDEWPGKFNGVRLVGGLHSDPMLGGNPLIQAGLYLVTGWSKIQNVKAAEILTAAWISDMFAGDPASPYYGTPGTVLEIHTPRGTAEAYVAPGPPETPAPLDVVFQMLATNLFSLDFATCKPPSEPQIARRMGAVIELRPPNTALSLDGGTKPGQSIGQRCMQG